ncbi:FUSC family protein [Nonomuraea sp. ATR24]|uniref:FUSC family protein n=1 Tax=Nonomuraea TaxID=83681 RepID=UPI001C5EADCE|nr:FUSC family protein [Nonomuraea ceibae]
MSREGAEHALRTRAAERDRISGDLLDLESHTTYQLLKGASLRGATQARWSAALDALGTLWSLNDAYRAVLRTAEQVRGERSRLGGDQLERLTELLSGPSVVLKAPARPVEQRSLLPQADERLTLDETVLRMDAAFRTATDALTEIDAAWTALLPRLDEADRTLRDVRELHGRLGEPADLTSAESGLARLRAAVLADPLDAGPVKRELDPLLRRLAETRAGLERAVAVKDEYATRRENLVAALDDVRAAESEARLAHGRVVVKIALPPQAQPRTRVPELVAELDALDVAAGAWVERAERLTGLEERVRQAAAQARATAAALAGLIGRRDELRGLLGASQAKAARQGTVEDPEALRLYERARLLLWTAPCDLTEAAQAVELYKRAIHGGGR